MSGATASPAKTCIVCRKDCSRVPRTKDAQGRYTCEACLKPASAESPVGAPASAPASAPGSAEVPLIEDACEVLGLSQARPAGPALARPDDGLPYSLSPQAPEKPDARSRPTWATGAGPGAKCAHCGYDVSKSGDRCPECGAKVTLSRFRTPDLEEESRDIARQTYLRPVYVMIAGLATIGIAGAVWGIAPVQIAASYAVWAIGIPLSLLCLWIAKKTFIDYDDTWVVATLQLAAVGAVIAGVSLLMPFRFGFMASFALAVVLYITVMDMDKIDAVCFTVFGVFFNVALTIAVSSAMG